MFTCPFCRLTAFVTNCDVRGKRLSLILYSKSTTLPTPDRVAVFEKQWNTRFSYFPTIWIRDLWVVLSALRGSCLYHPLLPKSRKFSIWNARSRLGRGPFLHPAFTGCVIQHPGQRHWLRSDSGTPAHQETALICCAIKIRIKICPLVIHTGVCVSCFFDDLNIFPEGVVLFILCWDVYRLL